VVVLLLSPVNGDLSLGDLRLLPGCHLTDLPSTPGRPDARAAR
jgi:hypothetical protein